MDKHFNGSVNNGELVVCGVNNKQRVSCKYYILFVLYVFVSHIALIYSKGFTYLKRELLMRNIIIIIIITLLYYYDCRLE